MIIRIERPCGTEPGYARHRRKGEPACAACKLAVSAAKSRREGTPRHVARGRMAFFYAKVALPNEQGCMLWLGALDASGYGRCGGKWHEAGGLAHRISLWEAEGPPPDLEHQDAAHACRNRHCVAPAHLRWATPLENSDDKVRDGTKPVGSRCGSSKLTEAAVADIRQAMASGTATAKELASRHGVSKWSVYSAVTRYWRHVEGEQS